jgi:hypothetical protein
VVGRNILLLLGGVLLYREKLACDVNAALDLRQSPTVVVPDREEFNGREDLVEVLPTPTVA